MPKDTAQTPYDFDDAIWLAGDWVRGEGDAMTNENPWTGETILRLHAASEDQVDKALSRARDAQADWAALPPAARSARLAAVADLIETRAAEIADWIVREAGGTQVKAKVEVGLVTAVFRGAATLPHRVEGRILPEDIPGKESRAYRKPVGVVALISPWNFPLQLTARTLAPALATGNAVVIKPASDTPVTGGLIFARLLEEAGLPPGLVSVLPGPGKTVGDALVRHRIPRVVSFTGSTPVGRGIARAAAEADILKRLELELGGNSPIVVLDDADLDQAVEAAIWGKFMHQGQICMIANRIIVEAGIHDAFVQAFVDRARQLKIGDAAAPDTFIGPIINDDQFDQVTGLIEKARAEGATELLGGDPKGRVIPPHVFTGVKPDSCLLTQEIFGPVVAIQKVADEDEALRMANATDYGLSSAVFTGDVARGLRFAQRVEAGMTHINDQTVNDSPFSPFGGEKNSGLGRFNGDWAVAAFTTDHWITLQHSPRAYPFSAKDL